MKVRLIEWMMDWSFDPLRILRLKQLFRLKEIINSSKAVSSDHMSAMIKAFETALLLEFSQFSNLDTRPKSMLQNCHSE